MIGRSVGPPRLFFSPLWRLYKLHPLSRCRSSPFLMTCRRFGSLTIGETTETESIAAVAGRAPAAHVHCIRDLAPPSPRTAV